VEGILARAADELSALQEERKVNSVWSLTLMFLCPFNWV